MFNLNTDEKQKEAVANAKSFLMHPFWIYLKSLVENDINLLKRRLATEEFEDIKEIHKIQQKITAYEDILETPSMVIEKYDPETKQIDVTENSLDPYESIEEFRLNLRRDRKAS